jgi:uncharacterized protein (DUF58 family)
MFRSSSRAEPPPAATGGAAAVLTAPAATGRDPERLLRQLEWTVLRRLDGLVQGDHRTLFRGFGLELADLREYQLHDDVRHIDWNVTARLQTPHVREFQEEREVEAWFVLDLSASLDFGSQQVRKRALAAELVGLLARLFTRYGNRVGAVLHGGRGRESIPARNGRRHVLHLLDRVLRLGAAPTAEPGDGGALTDLGALIEASRPLIRRRAVVFVVSDFISAPGWGRSLARLATRHELIAVRLFDPLEVELPDLGLIVMQDAETGEQLLVDTHDRGFRERFERAARQREAALRGALADAGVDCLELGTDMALDEALLAFAQLRKRRSQLGAGGPPAMVGDRLGR